jgi:hypothetical protein
LPKEKEDILWVFPVSRVLVEQARFGILTGSNFDIPRVKFTKSATREKHRKAHDIKKLLPTIHRGFLNIKQLVLLYVRQSFIVRMEYD